MFSTFMVLQDNRWSYSVNVPYKINVY